MLGVTGGATQTLLDFGTLKHKQTAAEAALDQATAQYRSVVLTAFQNVAADHLTVLDHDIDCDILVCGNDADARECVVGLAEDAAMRAWHGGRIENAVVAEALTSALIFMNNRYKIPGSGIRITGTPGSAKSADP